MSYVIVSFENIIVLNIIKYLQNIQLLIFYFRISVLKCYFIFFNGCYVRNIRYIYCDFMLFNIFYFIFINMYILGFIMSKMVIEKNIWNF